MAEPSERLSSTLNSKIHSDSGYGSNKSNSQSQRSSGSSKSHQSSMSSGSGSGYPPHPNAPVSNADCQQHGTGSPNTPGTSGQATNKRQGKKKMTKQGERKPTAGDKNETRTSQETQGKEVPKNSQLIDQGTNAKNFSLPSTPHTPQPHGQMSPASKASSTHDSKALQVAALTHVLSCMKKFQDPIQAYYSLLQEESEMNENGECDDCIHPNKVNWEDFIAENQKEAGNEDGFATVVSLDDGVVVYMTPTLANILGFPKDMLLGRSFIDFVHPKDKMAFASHITCGINFPIGDQSQCMQNPQGPSVKSEPFYCRLRQYRGLKTVGFGVTDKTMMYFPFKLTMQLKKVEIPARPGGSMSKPGQGSKLESDSLKDTITNTSSSDGLNEPAKAADMLSPVYLVICATRIKSAYQYPQEVPKNPGKFITRHSASCHFGHMDADAISYLGHLPQDLIGNSVLDYYHPEDLSLLKDIYGSVMQEQGKPFRSKPYRFRVFNGTFAILETDWSCFINPWSWKLEFVIGQHRVIEGPMNPNVFMQPKDGDEEGSQIPEQATMKEMILQDEIRKTLTETVSRRISDPLRQQSSRRRKDLAVLMETLLEKMAKTENSEKSGSQCSGFSVLVSCKERDSVMLGEISPHHDHDDRSGSNQSSSTPPSYNQLNYRENIERFFQSQPKTERSEESADQNKMDTQNQSSESDSKSSPNVDYSSGSNMRNSSGSNESGNDRAECASPQNSLTQELLTRHNQDMERCMMQKHRESRGKSSMTPGSHRDSRYKHSENFPSAFRPASSRSMDDSLDFVKPQNQKGHRSKPKHHKAPVHCDPTHGLKRTGNFSWDGDSHAGHAKQPHLDRQSDSNSVTASNSNMADPNGGGEFDASNSINLWPPFSISVTPGITTPSYRQTGPYPCYAFANPSSAVPAVGVPTKALPGVCLPGYHYIDPVTGVKQPAMLQVPHPSTPMAAPPSAASSSLPGGTSANSTPYIFLPGQQQFQQVQLLPAGVVYQPVSHHQMFGQHTPILMPLGTMIHPGQSILMATNPSNQLGQAGAPGGILHGSGYNFISIPTPPVSVADSRTSKSNSASKSSGGIPSLARNSGGLVMSKSTSTKVSSAVIPPTGTPVRSSGVKLPGRSKNRGYCSVGETTSRENDVQRSQGSRDSITDSSQSGSDDSMNASSKDSSHKNMEEDQSSQSCWDDGDNLEREESEKLQRSLRNKEPPWLQNVVMSDALKFTYQMPQGNEDDILRKDMKALKIFGQQSSAVNEQLAMLYREMDMDGCLDTGLHLEEGISSSSGEERATSEVPESKREKKHKKKMCHHRFDKMSLAFDEGAPFPPESIGGSWPKCKNPKSSKGLVTLSSKKDESNGKKVQTLHLPPPPPPKGKKSKKLMPSATATEAAA